MLLFGMTRLYMEGAGDPPAGGGAPPAPPAPPPAKTFTQQQKDADEAKLRRKYDRQLKEQQQALEKAQQEAEEARKKLAARDANPLPPTPNPTPDPNDPNAGQLEILQKRFEREREEREREINALREQTEKERQTRLKLQRDQQLDQALREAGVQSKHMVQARRYFLPQIEWDKVDEKWAFRTLKGNIVDIVDGVSEELPDNLKPSRMPNGGAGNVNGTPAAQQQKARALKEAEALLAELKDKHRRGGGKQSDLAAFTAQKRVVDQLKRALNTPK